MRSEVIVPDLVRLSLRELPAMRLPDGMYCEEVHAEDMRPQGRSLRYSVMVALGMLKARGAGYEVGQDLDGLLDLLLGAAADHHVTAGDVGLLLWLNQRAGGDYGHVLLAALDQRLEANGGLRRLQGMEVAWIAIGCCECIGSGSPRLAERLFSAARGQLCSGNRGPRGLLLHRGVGRRRRFPNFATQIYGILALSKIGRLGDHDALVVAREVADSILRLQQRDGGWPWLFDAYRGRTVEPYEIYSVHQDAMAPMGLLELYEVTDDIRYRRAAIRGLGWISGENALGRTMLDQERQLIYRSIRRKAPWDRAMLYLNTAGAFVGVSAGTRRRTPLEVNPTDRPYHLGWLLEAWCGRESMTTTSYYE